MDNYKKIQEAKAFLKENGFYTDSLWCVEDVQDNYDCTEEEAQEVLDGALNNEATMEQIWFAINFHAENLKLEQIEEGKEILEQEIENSKAKEVKKTYYLIGSDATKEYYENGIEGVLNDYEANELSFSTFCFIEGETRSSELAQALSGYDDYAIITEEEYNLIN